MILSELNDITSLTEGDLITKIQAKAWSGCMSCETLRPLYWRICFGLLDRNSSNWVQNMNSQVDIYVKKKSDIVKRENVSIDPLSALLENNSEWDSFYKVFCFICFTVYTACL